MDERIKGDENVIHCTNCIYKNLCTPFEKLLYTEYIKKDEEEKYGKPYQNQHKKECKCFIDINGFDNGINNKFNNNYTNGEYIWSEMDGETVWKEMSWYRYKDNLFDYIEDN